MTFPELPPDQGEKVSDASRANRGHEIERALAQRLVDGDEGWIARESPAACSRLRTVESLGSEPPDATRGEHHQLRVAGVVSVTRTRGSERRSRRSTHPEPG